LYIGSIGRLKANSQTVFEERKMVKRGVWVGVVALWTAWTGQAATFKTVAGDEKNVVQFVSEATMEKIVGKTSNITGEVDFNLDNLAESGSATFTVNLETIDTGISLRNQHMRENHLHTDKFPEAKFKLKSLSDLSETKLLADGNAVKAIAQGEFTIHGVSKEYSIPIELRLLSSSESSKSRLGGSSGNLLYVTANWTVALADHMIPRPEFLFLKLSPEQKVSISVAMTDQ
jgi:polyisoprenoid-binding protein YceI